MARRPADVPASEACFQTAIATARDQQAKSLELRASVSLTRLWTERGKRRQTRDLLAGICDRFSEGFNTLDLQEAQTLLGELDSRGIN